MLKRIKIENLRGIREGQIDGLTRLVVLVGANGSGKSTILEGAFIGGSQQPAAAVGAVVRRRIHTGNGARWLMRGGSASVIAALEVEWHEERPVRRVVVKWNQSLREAKAINYFNEMGYPGPYSALHINWAADAAMTAMAANNEYQAREADVEFAAPPLRFADPLPGRPLYELFSDAVVGGHRNDITDLARVVVPELQTIEMLAVEGEPELFFTFPNGAVPVGLAGDGIHALVRMMFHLSGLAGGTLLIEEPEMHMHPKGAYACAKAIVGAVRRNVQVVMTTHSLEIIDLLLSELTDDEVMDPGMMSLQKIRLRDGLLTAIAIPAFDAEQARTALSEDLR